MQEPPSSKMASKHYCPKCDSFNLKRLHRGYFKKVILKQPVQYTCRACYEEVSESKLAQNEVREVPVFISAA